MFCGKGNKKKRIRKNTKQHCESSRFVIRAESYKNHHIRFFWKKKRKKSTLSLSPNKKYIPSFPDADDDGENNNKKKIIKKRIRGEINSFWQSSSKFFLNCTARPHNFIHFMLLLL